MKIRWNRNFPIIVFENLGIPRKDVRPFFRKVCKFAIFYLALVLLAAITTIIPERNVQRFITRAEPLYHSFNPLFCDVFSAVVVCIRSLSSWAIKFTVSTYQCTVCFYVCDLNSILYLNSIWCLGSLQ